MSVAAGPCLLITAVELSLEKTTFTLEFRAMQVLCACAAAKRVVCRATSCLTRTYAYIQAPMTNIHHISD